MSPSTTWVDFKAVKAAVTVEMIVSHYGLELQKKGKELVGLCPFHTETKPSFRMNPEKRVWKCFGCGSAGNLTDFVAKKEGCGIKDAALRMSAWFNLDAVTEKENDTKGDDPQPEKKRDPSSRTTTEHVEETESQSVPRSATNVGDLGSEKNPPLGFELQKLDPTHPYLTSRASESVISEFGLGFCSKGMHRGRIAIPLHDQEGILVGYAGRWADATIPEGEEKYKFPKGFIKSAVLYNLHRITGSHVVLVEGFFGCFRLHESGIPVVALMGSSISDAQCRLLLDREVRGVTLLLDGDPGGSEGTAQVVSTLVRHLFVKAPEVPAGFEPDIATKGDVLTLIGQTQS